MGKEAVSYLDQEIQTALYGWVEGIVPVIERHPALQDVDLVVEGGVGSGRITAHIARWLFPKALYIGTDIADAFEGYLRRLRGEIDDKTLRKVLDANQNPSVDMKKAIVYGNCFDWELIADITYKTGTRHPLLISKNALFALLDRKANLWDRKREEDVITVTGMTQIPNIYKEQLHLGIDWTVEPQGNGDRVSDVYYNLEHAAQNAGWTTERFDVGLLMIQETHQS